MGFFRSRESADPTALYLADPNAGSAPAGHPPGPTTSPVGYPSSPATMAATPMSYPPPPIRRRRRLRTVAAIAFWVVVALAAPVFFGIRTFTVAGGPLGPPLTGAIEAPTTVNYGGGRIAVSVGAPVVQPGAEWTESSASDKPSLVLPVTIDRVDDGSDTLDVQAWDWHLTPSTGGPRVQGDLVNAYSVGEVDGRPTRDSSPSLKAGQTYTGTIAFPSPATGGEITLQNPDTQHDVVQWKVVASVARTVRAKLGKPARGAIGAPEFIVTATKPRWVKVGDPSLITAPNSGSYLVLDVVFTADPGEVKGTILRNNLAFLPKGARAPIQSQGPGVLDEAFFFTSLTGGDVLKGAVAFDSRRTAGTVELLDGAGRPVVTWAVPG